MQERETPALTEVFLRIEHDTALPEEITAMLGITPTSTAGRGQVSVAATGAPYPCNVWVLSSSYAVVSKDTQDHFQWLLESLGPCALKVLELGRHGYRAQIHCLWMGKGGYGGPELSPQIMRGLADLGVEVCFDLAVLHG